MEPKILKGITDEDYNQIPALRATVLKELIKSPLHARYCMDNQREPTEALIFGRLLHSFLLENQTFSKNHYFLDRKLDFRKKEDKELKASLEAQYSNIISLDVAEQLTDMRQAALKNPAVANALKSISDVELSLIWQSDSIACKARLDGYSKQLKAIIDIKTCQDASPRGFARSLFSYGYHIQAAHYLEGARACGLAAKNFIFIAIEKKEPFACAAYRLETSSLMTAQTLRCDLLEKYSRCEATNRWQGYSDRIEDIAIPEWASREVENNFLGE